MQQQAPTQQNQRTSTNTQIRNFYAEGVSYMNTKFYNTSFAIALYPFTGKDENGRSNFDTKGGVATTISYEGAAGLSQICGDILNGTIQEVSLSIPCFNASMLLERRPANGQMETVLIITKNNITVTFPFATMQAQIKENGVPQTRTIDVGLAAFKATVDGYLTGINADRHLDKLTEDYAKTLGSLNNPQPQQQPQQQRNNYQKQGYQNNYNRNRQYQPRNNGNPSFNQPKANNWGPSQQFDSYNVPN